MESWGNLLSSLEGDEIESIFQSVSDHHMDTSTSDTRPSLDTTRHDSGVSVVSAKEEDTDTTSVSTPQDDHLLPDNTGSVAVKDHPTKKDFDNALWVTTKLNGITQYRAPRYTTSPTVSLSHTSILHPTFAKESTAIDLCTSASSFALQCAAAGCSKTLCWDINLWNTESLRRSCLKNKWHIQIHHSDDIHKDKSVKMSPRTKVVAFVEGQETALDRIQKMRTQLPPIRYVRCEDSSTSQVTAAAALDPKSGGWIYVQAAFGTEFVSSSANQIRVEFEKVVKRLDQEREYLTENEGTLRRPVVEYIQRGGSCGLDVVSCVVIIHIPPLRI